MMTTLNSKMGNNSCQRKRNSCYNDKAAIKAVTSGAKHRATGGSRNGIPLTNNDARKAGLACGRKVISNGARLSRYVFAPLALSHSC